MLLWTKLDPAEIKIDWGFDAFVDKVRLGRSGASEGSGVVEAFVSQDLHQARSRFVVSLDAEFR